MVVSRIRAPGWSAALLEAHAGNIAVTRAASIIRFMSPSRVSNIGRSFLLPVTGRRRISPTIGPLGPSQRRPAVSVPAVGGANRTLQIVIQIPRLIDDFFYEGFGS